MKRFFSIFLHVLFCLCSILGTSIIFLWWMVTESWRMPHDVEDES